MEPRLYRSETFLAADEHFHLSRKPVPQEVPDQPHHHDFYEVFLVEEGAVRHWVNGQSQTVEAGHLVFIRPSDMHMLSSVPGSRSRVINLLFRRETADHIGARYASDVSGRYFWSPKALPTVHGLAGARLERIVAAAHGLQVETRSLARLEEFLLSLMTQTIDKPDTAETPVPLWLILACERARAPAIFRDGAAGFVRAAERGHEHVCRKTKEHLGVTPSALINRIRMEHAAHLLADADMSVNDVADDCGIENMSHFYRVFRQHYGVTPKVFRRQHQKTPF